MSKGLDPISAIAGAAGDLFGFGKSVMGVVGQKGKNTAIDKKGFQETSGKLLTLKQQRQQRYLVREQQRLAETEQYKHRQQELAEREKQKGSTARISIMVAALVFIALIYIIVVKNKKT